MRRWFNYLKKCKIKIFVVLLIIVFTILFIPINHGNSIFNYITNTKNLYASVSAERQANWDKMKVEYLNVKNRITGTAPFNSGDVSNDNGVDVSDKDDYVRTLDVMRYTVELGVAPNTNVEGVTDTSSFQGGVIKVRAKLPNQGDLILMTWEQDAWMQNVSYNADKTEIYAEYHVANGVSVTNANQNLTFTVKVGGYKKEVTKEMAPEFEVWMEGNKPDDIASKANSINVKDKDRSIVISGHESIDVMVSANGHKVTGTYKGKKGSYINLGVGFALKQNVSGFSDLRGDCIP